MPEHLIAYDDTVTPARLLWIGIILVVVVVAALYFGSREGRGVPKASAQDNESWDRLTAERTAQRRAAEQAEAEQAESVRRAEAERQSKAEEAERQRTAKEVQKVAAEFETAAAKVWAKTEAAKLKGFYGARLSDPKVRAQALKGLANAVPSEFMRELERLV